MSDPHDWEADPRPFAACLKDWRKRHAWSWQATADELRKPLVSVLGMSKGRVPMDERSLRRLMTLIDHHDSRQ